MKLVIFDTNAWLDLYMIHPLALKEIVAKFTKEKSMFWIPEQVYWEFSHHSKQKRECALNVIKNASSNSRNNVQKAKDQIKKELVFLKNNNVLSDEKIISDIETKFEEIRANVKHELEKLNGEYQKEMGIISEEEDVVYKLVDEIYTTNPPYQYSAVQRIALYEEGEMRIKYHIPPGITDSDKEDSNEAIVHRRRYGDFLIWKDLLRKTEELVSSLAVGEKLQVIFVENERKGDWWISRGKPMIAPVLAEEFAFIVNGKAEIEMLSFTDFLSNYSMEFGIEETAVSSLVEKNRYKERVISEINSSTKEIIENSLMEYFSISKRYENLFMKKCHLGGRFDSVKDFTIDITEIDNVKIEEVDKGICLVGKIGFEYAGMLTESIENEQTVTDNVKDTSCVMVSIEISIDYSQGYEENHYDVGNVYVKGIQESARSMRKIVFQRDGYTCQMCGKTLKEGVRLCVDHIFPRSLGGSDDLSNLQTLCTECNARKGNKIMQPITVCSDCGRNIYYWNDGGNGFCCDCASEH